MTWSTGLELRCPDCDRLIFKYDSGSKLRADVKCPRCKATWEATVGSTWA